MSLNHNIKCEHLKILALSLLSFFISFEALGDTDIINLSREWQYSLSNAPSSVPGEGYINLPSTLDASRKSAYIPEGENTSQLRREFTYTGEAVYYREINIPQNWEDKEITLFLERTKPASIRIDGEKVGYSSVISAPQRYDLTEFLTPGWHNIEILVNNADSIPPIVARSSSAVSESTQTNWNGILGEMRLEARNKFNIKGISIDDRNVPDNVKINVDFSERAPAGMKLRLIMGNEDVSTRTIKTGSSSLFFEFPISKDDLWSANSPMLHDLKFVLSDSSGRVLEIYEVTTGFRKFSTKGKMFTINGDPIFLRGAVNSSIFPKTGYAPTDFESWLTYFKTMQEYGINHVRFHSWTPPEAAFKAADQLGMYLLVELPIWGELDRDLKFHNRFLKQELKSIMKEYGHHPSFVMFSPGNELWGDLSLMGEYMKEAKFYNPRILATYGTNVYLGMKGKIGDEDFIISSKLSDDPKTAVRGSMSYADSRDGGILNSSHPNTEMNFEEVVESIDVPVIAHEVGQYQSYPDFTEIEKYRGNLKPDNLKEFKKRAVEAGLYSKSKAFNKASGQWVAELYKAEMEMAQRSPGIAGYELFGLQDYPAQGTALVGILDPFMESKGFITPEKWRESASDVMLMAEFPKFGFIAEETVEIPIVAINYSEEDEALQSIRWKTDFSSGSLFPVIGKGILHHGTVDLKMPKVKNPRKYTFTLNGNNGEVLNSYDFYVYPKKKKKVKNVVVTDNLTEALILLDQGERVIFYPDQETAAKATLGPLFTTDFWNYRMFRTICDEMELPPSPGTLGLLINDKHPAFKKFPTSTHTEWQWYPVVANSRPLITDRLPKDFEPVIEVIDNVERNFRLALMLECKVGKGKLIIVSTDLEKASKYPEGDWLLQSLKEYAGSKEFKPAYTLSPEQIVNLVTKPSTARMVKELKNETYNSVWE